MNNHSAKVWKVAAVLAAVVLLVVAYSCGGRGSRLLHVLPGAGSGAGSPAAPAQGPQLVMLKDASGAPAGVKVYWWRCADTDVTGYFVYRDTQPIITPDPALRVNNGELVPQPPEGTNSVQFSDLFPAETGMTYYYRVTAVDGDWDESEFSQQRSITISEFSILSFSPTAGKYGQIVTISGRYFGLYDEETDAVYFSGVRNTKGPSELVSSLVKAQIDVWEPSRIRARVPVGATVGPLTIEVGGTMLETVDDFVCTSPYLILVTPDPCIAGQQMHFYGANFGPPDGMNRLVVNDVSYGGVFRSWSDDHEVATLPKSLQPGLSKLELFAGGELSNPYWGDILSGDTPIVRKIYPEYVDPGTQVLIEGQSFGSSADEITVWFNGIEVAGADLDFFSESFLELTAPDGMSRTGEVYVVVTPASAPPMESNHYLYHALTGYSEYSADGPVAGLDCGQYSDVAFDASGNEYILYSCGPADETSSLILAYEDAGEWVTEELDSVWGELRGVRVSVDTGGVVHFAYHYRTPNGDGGVYYGWWDDGTISEQLVYSAGTGMAPGEYLDMKILDDGAGNIDRLLVWSNELESVMCGYKLAGDSDWTTDVVYVADTGYEELAGYYCSLDVVELPVTSPPPGEGLQPPYLVGIAFGLYTESAGPHYELLLAYCDDLEAGEWSWERCAYSETAITETCLRLDSTYVLPFILWSTANGVYWTYFADGFETEELTSGDGPYGAALGLTIDEWGNQYAYGHNGADEFFFGSFGDPDWSWHVETFTNTAGRQAELAGRGGATELTVDGVSLSVYDPYLRDVALVEYHYVTGTGWVADWTDIADGFANPGYDLSNRSIVSDSYGNPYIVFGDNDPLTEEHTLWLARPPWQPKGAPGSVTGWEFYQLDSTTSEELGYATVAVDKNNELHIAYMKGMKVMYNHGYFGEFGSPVEVETVLGLVQAAPQIALGVNSPQDINILALAPGSTNELWLLQSEDGMVTHTKTVTHTSPSLISQFGLAVKWNGEAVAAAYLDSPDNAVVVWDQTTGTSQTFSSTTGMNAGLTLTLDEDMHYCVTLADLEGTGAGYYLHYDGSSQQYVLDEFVDDADGSLTMSQWRTEYGPFISYLDKSYFSPVEAYTDCYVYYLDYSDPGGTGNGPRWEWIRDFNGETVEVRHSVDPWTFNQAWFAFYTDEAGEARLIFETGPDMG